MDMRRVQERVATIARNRKVPSPPRGATISKLGLQRRTLNMLNNGRIWRINELVEMRPSEVIKLRNCGYVTLLEIQSALKVRGYRLKKEDADA